MFQSVLTKFFQRDPPTEMWPRVASTSTGRAPNVEVVIDSKHRQWHHVKNQVSATQATLPESPLVQLAGITEIWNMICENCTGNSIACLVNCNPFRRPTLNSPAYTLLSGVDFEGFLCPWADPANVLAVYYKGWNPDFHFRVAVNGGFSGLTRDIAASQAVDLHVNPLNAVGIYDVARRNLDGVCPPHTSFCYIAPSALSFHGGRRPYYNGGPARPPTPSDLLTMVGPEFAYTLPNPCVDQLLDPALFPETAHMQEKRKRDKRSFACPGDSDSSDLSDEDV